MALLNNVISNKNVQPVLLGVLLLTYLYLDTPLPFVLILQNLSLGLSILASLAIVCYLCKTVNIYVAIVFALVAFEVIRKSVKPDLNNLNKKVQYYNNLIPSSDVVISDRLKESNTLEQDIVENMVPVTNKEIVSASPRYQALLPDLAGASTVD